MSLLQSIAHLPQVIQDLIGEYNVDHRVSFQTVLDEMQYFYGKSLHQTEFCHVMNELQQIVEPYDMMICSGCSDYVRHYSSELELEYYNNRYYYCSYHCMNECYYEMRKHSRRFQV